MHRTLVPWATAATLAVIGVAEILLDHAFSAAPAVPAVALAAVVAGAALGGRFPVTGAAVVALAFPIAVAGGLNGPTGAAVFGFFLAPGLAGYLRAAASWPAPLAAQLMASLGTWIAARAAGSTVSGVAAMAWENLFFGVLCWGAWGVGLLARRLRDRAELLARLTTALDAERDAREHAVVAEERQRIARDMHDAVAHSISVMVLQLGAVRATLPPGTPQAEMLEGVERLGRESVRELHSLVGMLRDTAAATTAPQPSLPGFRDLVAEVRADLGLRVDVAVDGDPAGLSPRPDISAFRMLQEALTNVLRHAGPAATACVQLTRTASRHGSRSPTTGTAAGRRPRWARAGRHAGAGGAVRRHPRGGAAGAPTAGSPACAPPAGERTGAA